jgi:hypothetical protein
MHDQRAGFDIDLQVAEIDCAQIVGRQDEIQPVSRLEIDRKAIGPQIVHRHRKLDPARRAPLQRVHFPAVILRVAGDRLARVEPQGEVDQRDPAPGRFRVCFYGAVSTLVIYGGVMNPASVLMFQSSPTWEMFAASYAAGFWYDLIHAACTTVVLWMLYVPMREKLVRVRRKYGLL